MNNRRNLVLVLLVLPLVIARHAKTNYDNKDDSTIYDAFKNSKQLMPQEEDEGSIEKRNYKRGCELEIMRTDLPGPPVKMTTCKWECRDSCVPIYKDMVYYERENDTCFVPKMIEIEDGCRCNVPFLL